MARSTLAKTQAASEALEAFLRARPPPRHPAAADGSEPTAPPAAATTARQPNAQAGGAPHPARQPPLRLPHSDWLHHRLTVTGPAEALDAFQDAACGAGTIPWQLDMASLEEDWFHRLVDPAHRSLSLHGARVLAAQLGEAVERRHTLAVARVGRSRACRFDLHALVPVPPGILALGPDHPDALLWLWEHWGTTEPLRHVAADTTHEARREQAHAGPGLRLQFWSADWTPWRALAQIRADWPALQLDMRPSYD